MRKGLGGVALALLFLFGSAPAAEAAAACTGKCLYNWHTRRLECGFSVFLGGACFNPNAGDCWEIPCSGVIPVGDTIGRAQACVAPALESMGTAGPHRVVRLEARL